MKKKPNIVFIYVDDMGYKDLACTGSSFYETPNIDKLRQKGMQFTNAYAACPVCSPSRASLLTGKYPARLGVTNYIRRASDNFHPSKGKLIDAPYVDHLPKSEKTIAHYLSENGYNTWHIGKWHLGESEFYPDKCGFDINLGGCHLGYLPQGYFSPYNIETLEDGPKGEYLTDRLTDEAISLIKNCDDKPFFLNLWHYAVHVPTDAKQKHIEYFEEKAKKMGLDKVQAIETGDYFPTEHKSHLKIERRVVQSNPEYAALIYSLDENVGRLIKVLEDTNKIDDTIVIFTSDNGGLSTAEGSPTCNAPAREGKGWVYDGGIRVPLIMCYNGVIEQNSTCKTPTTTPDLFATLLNIAGVNYGEEDIDGINIMPCLKGEDIKKRPIFWHYPHYGNQGGTPAASVLYGNYKLLHFFEDDIYELYNINEDVSQTNNLIKEKSDVATELKSMLKYWQDKLDVLYPSSNLNYCKG